MIDLTPYHRFGEYVTPYDYTREGGPPRGFVFDGDSGVPDYENAVAARHDWDYLVGESKLVADARYMAGYAKRGRPAMATWRWVGLTAFGWWAYYSHRLRARKTMLAERIAERVIPMADTEIWNWLEVSRTWKLSALRERLPDRWTDFSPDDC